MATATEKFDIKNRFTGEVIFSAELKCSPDALPSIKLGLAVRMAVKVGANLSHADLSHADLSGADLSRAYLSGADLSGADLSGADLSRADLSGADLSRADLSRAYLSRADLSHADLSGADLSRAYLSGADLSRADLSRAYLSRADLSHADLSGADLSRAENLTDEQLRPFKADLWMTLAQNRSEVPGLVAALREGRVDGSQYEGSCACLVGTIANAAGVDYRTLDHNAAHPAERWFMMIRKGDKPGDESGGGFAAAKALAWAEEFVALQ